MVTVDYLKEKFKIKEDKELAAIFVRSPGAVGQWRAKGSVPASIQLLANELMSNMNINSDQPPTIGEVVANYGPEAKKIAETIEMIVEGKTEEERRDLVKNIMSDLWKKYT